jgi:membrane associated rhomboid family serine protease
MIPLSDHMLRRHGWPLVTWGLIAANIAVFLYQISLPEPQQELLVSGFGTVPREITTGHDFPPTGPPIIYLTLLTSMFLHGGFLHIGGNMLYLWVFGDNIEDALGKIPYLLFYLGTGIIAGLSQVAIGPQSSVPAIGASGAIAGVLGAYIRLFPTARVTTLVIFFYFIRLVPVPAWVLLGFWFVLQFLSGASALGGAGTGEGVAYFAHIGGFAAGFLLIGFLPKRQERRPTWWQENR